MRTDSGFPFFRHTPLIISHYDAIMALTRILPLLTASLLALTGTVHAAEYVVSASGQFSNPAGNQADQLWAPNGIWALSFDVSSSPAVSNTTTLSFDVPVTQFTYKLNGATVAAAPSNISFYTSGDGGLFTLFFGSESGSVNGVPIPEFIFEGAQAFSDSTTSPAFSMGSFAVSGVLYSDAVNYDAGITSSPVTLAPVPEPSTGLFCFLPLFGLAFPRVRRFLNQN